MTEQAVINVFAPLCAFFMIGNAIFYYGCKNAAVKRKWHPYIMFVC